MGNKPKRGQKDAGQFADQYGDAMVSQDRDHHHAGSGKGAGGGGDAGGGSRRGGGDSLTFQRHVPKFLQAHAHLLGSGQAAGEGLDDASLGGARPGPGSDDDEDDALDKARRQATLLIR